MSHIITCFLFIVVILFYLISMDIVYRNEKYTHFITLYRFTEGPFNFNKSLEISSKAEGGRGVVASNTIEVGCGELH